MEDQDTSHIDVLEISVSVPDRDKAVQEFRDRLGLEPYAMMEAEVPGVTLHGKEIPPFKTKMAFFRAGPVRLELLEAEGGIYAEYFRKHGPGVNHIGCRVADVDYEVDWFKKRGVETVSTIDGGPFGKWAYLDMESIIGFHIELIQTSLREPGMLR